MKEVGGVLGDGMRVGLQHNGRSRIKKARKDIEISPFVNGTLL